jgi:hypothetical protein
MDVLKRNKFPGPAVDGAGEDERNGDGVLGMDGGISNERADAMGNVPVGDDE